MVQLDTEVKNESETLTDFSLFSSTLYGGVKSTSSVDKFTCMASVRVPDEDENDDTPTDTTRAPVLVVAVVDKSGSMSGPKMTSLKTTLQFIIAELGKNDKLAIVEYDTNVTTSLPVTLMNEEGKARAKRACDALQPGSATNLSGGLLEGLRLIPNDLGSDTVVSTLLLTDGLANHGIRTAKGIIAMVQKAQSEGIGRSTVNTFGFGSDHDATMLKEIAQACEGTYYFVENEDSIASAFADCIGGLLSVRAQGVELEIETSEGIVLGDVFTGKPVAVVAPGRVVRIAMGDLQSGEERDVPFEVQLPSTTSSDAQAIASVKLRFYDMLKNEMRELVTEVKIARPDELTEQQKLPNLMVDRNCNRIKGAHAARDAIVFAEAKKFNEGRALLERVIAEIQASPSASEEFCVTLIAELRDSLASMRDQNEYRRVGQYKMNNFAHVMVHQRCANWSPSEPAATPAPVTSSAYAVPGIPGAPRPPPSLPSAAGGSALPSPSKKPMYSTNARSKMQSKWKK